MKFNRELDESAVPEWKEKYLDYKQAKKMLKAVARAIRSAGRSPLKPDQQPSPFAPSGRDGPVSSFLRRGWTAHGGLPRRRLPARAQSEVASSVWQRQDELESAATSRVSGMSGVSRVSSNVNPVDTWSPLRQQTTNVSNASGDSRPRMMRYGSIIGSPPGSQTPLSHRLSQQRTQVSTLELPNPALDLEISKGDQDRTWDDPEYDHPVSPGSVQDVRQRQRPARPPPTQLAHTGNAYQIRPPTDGAFQSSMHSGHRQGPKPRRFYSTPTGIPRSPLLHRMFSFAPSVKSSNRDNDVALEAYQELDFRQADFFHYLDKELDRIEEFYKEKEDEAIDRLKVLREQLHIMRNQRMDEIEASERLKKKQQLTHGTDGNVDPNDAHDADTSGDEATADNEPSRGRLPSGARLHHYKKSVVSQMDHALDRLEQVRTGHIGKTSNAMRYLGTPPSLGIEPDNNRDYTRKPQTSITYRAAKRKLKTAFFEYYRGLELLKSYVMLNHTAFRKITKKCDKTIAEQPGKTYMNDKVDNSRFVTSQTVDRLLNDVEDCYARYFERGNRKMAINKLRAKGYRTQDYTGSTIRTGFLGGAGIALAIDGFAHGIVQNWKGKAQPLPDVSTYASYLLQIYAGYFLLLLLLGLFCFACREFTRHKVNYRFIFEFDARHGLDWRQLSEMPALFLFMLGLTMDFNFNWIGPGSRWTHAGPMYIYWPVVLIGVTVVTLACPLPIYFHRSRRWFLGSIWRVFFSGLYSVEFRDLFFGDFFCSATYTFGNIELFFCLYAKGWNNPPRCNSSHSVLLGFLTTVPGIMRALQCVRRYIQTRNAFPHLANCGKYTCTILSYMSLSLFRRYEGWELLVVFTVFSTINSVYCSIWDIIMDFSFGDWSAKWPMIRKQMLFGHVWWYYGVLILDPILRFNWIFYVIYAQQTQHSSKISFCVALSEVIRRGIWALFRVENEQCANNRHLIAARAPPIPYSAPAQPVPPSEPETQDSPMVRTLKKVRSTAADAHTQDYERRKPKTTSMDIAESDEDEDEED